MKTFVSIMKGVGKTKAVNMFISIVIVVVVGYTN